MVLASEPVCICGVDVAAPQQLRARNSQHKMSMAELRSIFSRQFTEYEVESPHMPAILLSGLSRVLFHFDPAMMPQINCVRLEFNLHTCELADPALSNK